jgi:hypothetical protein
VKLAEGAGISLSALDAAAADGDASLPHPHVLLSIACSSVQGSSSINSRTNSSAAWGDSSCAATSSLQDNSSTAAACAEGADAADATADRDQVQQHQLQEQRSWCKVANGSSDHVRFEALALLRRLLALSRQQPGPAGLLGNTAAVNALQQLLPFVPLMQLATHNWATAAQGGSSSGSKVVAGSRDGAECEAEGVPASTAAASGNLFDLLPPVQRAWLLADAAEAVLLHDDDDSNRWVLLHCTAAQLQCF